MSGEAADSDGRKAVHMRIFGRVQGVWFRGWAVDEAQRRGLDGWVRNVSDGSVETLVAGPPDAVEEMVQLCRQGPPSAQVQDVKISRGSDPGPVGFRQTPTR